VEPLKNFGIINSITKLHLVGISTEQLNIFERKVYRRILGPVYDNEKEKLQDINQLGNLCKS
jgi:hypothetical protein